LSLPAYIDFKKLQKTEAFKFVCLLIHMIFVLFCSCTSFSWKERQFTGLQKLLEPSIVTTKLGWNRLDWRQCSKSCFSL